jgi:hypothetical protein
MVIAGTWSVAANISNAVLATSCSATDQVVVAQNGSQFSGTYAGTSVCTGPGGIVANNTAGTIGGGLIVNGTDLSFSDDAGCNYTGSGSGSPVNRLAGHVSCVLAYGGSTYAFTGTWQATH